MTKFDSVVTWGVGIAGLIGIGYAIGTHTKMAKISDMLDRSIDDLARSTTVDIPEEMVKRGVERAVDAAANRAVSKATDEVVREVKIDIRKQVSSAVEQEYSKIKDDVLKEISDAASKIDVARVRADVENKAEKMALEKFDSELDGVLAKFNDNLENTSKIYKSIANSISKNNDGKEFVFKVG